MTWPEHGDAMTAGATGLRGWCRTVLMTGLCLLALWHYRAGLTADLRVVLQPGSGQEALSPEVRRAIAMLRRHGATRYQLSELGRTPDSREFFERVVEGGYPMRLAPSAPFVLARDAVGVPPGCAEIERDERVSLARCP